ncbi:MAG: NAD(+) diphosphatase [Deltaproteobacteria bacterium]|nr:NAD(+) diphosphatase [Deltaproteobacteria bacterium]MBW2419540.1 NAD(+) diphosphatase [Deltaproteobacteria bacterium]
MRDSIVFTSSPLDRASNERRDAGWIEAQLRAESSRFLPLWRLQPLVEVGDERKLAWARSSLLDSVKPAPEPLLLGTHDGVAHFAVDVSSLPEPVEALGLEGAAAFEDLRAVAMALPRAETGTAAHARSMLAWHIRHSRCSVCGEPTRPRAGGANRICSDCGAEHFPRTDPVAIAAVIKEDRCLLGRPANLPIEMYTALAGFIEPGESIEEAVRREVAEETGVEVGAVRYLVSQPWPFPSSLMIGCLAEGLSEAITVDEEELKAARWFHRDELRDALEGRGGVMVPPALAVAHHLIRAFVEGEGDVEGV